MENKTDSIPIDSMQALHQDDGWLPLNGCNACINAHVCKSHGNCIILSIDKVFPDYNKKKRKLIQRIRTYGSGSIEQINLILKKAQRENEKLIGDTDARQQRIDTVNEWKDAPSEEDHIRWNGPINLTKLEQMFIDNLNRKR